jgi:gamma-D-glutamyl-L-lysine dipeptidyl-peptidase
MASVAILTLALLSPSPAAAPAPPGHREAVVVRTVENMYSAPSLDKDVTSQAYLGQVVSILETRGAFAKIETPDRYQGWAPAAALKPYATRSMPRYATKGRVAEVVSLVALVYREPDVTTYRPRARAPLGSRLELVKEATDGRWHRVRLPDGEEGFIQKGDVSLRDASDKTPRGSGSELVATARRLLGVPYLWGGMTPLGVDCSGFVSLVYRVHGRVLPRDADLQFDDPESSPVDRDRLAPGDLLFFGKTTITHVGMYTGDGGFIDATTYETPVVREDRLDDPHWVELYKGARRPK